MMMMTAGVLSSHFVLMNGPHLDFLLVTLYKMPTSDSGSGLRYTLRATGLTLTRNNVCVRVYLSVQIFFGALG